MPHAWIGSEYARVVRQFMREDDERLMLLRGTPQSWVEGVGLRVTELPTAFGKLTMAAKQQGDTLRITLGQGLRSDVPVHVSWPTRRRPRELVVDGKKVTTLDDNGARIERPFREMVAHW